MAIKIYIDQGHNPEGINAGAEGFGIREQDITYQVGHFLFDILSEDYRFTARLSRPTPQTTLGYSNTSSLKERVTQANTWKEITLSVFQQMPAKTQILTAPKLTFLLLILPHGISPKTLYPKLCEEQAQNIMVYSPDLLSMS